MRNDGMTLIAPRVTPVLDPFFRPAVLANHAFQNAARASNASVPLRFALEQADGSVSRFETVLFPESHPASAGNFIFVERLLKFFLWSRGGFRIHLDGPAKLGEQLQRHYAETSTGKFDAQIMGE